MCDHLECHGNGLKVSRTFFILHHPPGNEWPEGTVSDSDGWGIEVSDYLWIVEFRSGGFMNSVHKSWEEAMTWAWKYLELEAGHGG